MRDADPAASDAGAPDSSPLSASRGLAVRDRLAELTARYGLPPATSDRFEQLLELVGVERTAITSVRDPSRGVDVHIADSLVALEFEAVHRARRIADLGSGGGFPGLALAVALPAARITLVESAGRKCVFLRHVVEVLELGNVDVVHARAEGWPEGLGVHDLVTARALAPLPVLIEYAAPLLMPAGSLLAWKGRRDAAEESDGAFAAAHLGMTDPAPTRVRPAEGIDERHIYLSSKVTLTPPGFPRRPGMARKRPLKASTRR